MEHKFSSWIVKRTECIFMLSCIVLDYRRLRYRWVVTVSSHGSIDAMRVCAESRLFTERSALARRFDCGVLC